MIPTAKPDLSLPQQYMFLNRNPICTGEGQLWPTKLFWQYKLRATPLSREYTLRIDYQKGETPDVRVMNPDIQILATGRDLPHVYRNPLRLCLYLPGSGEWHARMRLDQTMVPWTATWLFYFEEWLASNEWKGGGEHPGNGMPELNRRVRRMRR